MALGRVEALCLGPVDEGPIQRVASIDALAGRGIEGDRYCDPPDAPGHDPSHEITLVAKEGVEAAAEESGVDLTFEDTRRNVVTAGVDLLQLIGSRFRVGEVELEAIREAAPCRHLQKLAGKPLLKPLIGRAGIRARIVTTGTIQVGDEIKTTLEEGS